MSPPIRRNCALSDLKLTFECLFTFTSRIGYVEMSAPYELIFHFIFNLRMNLTYHRIMASNRSIFVLQSQN